MAAPVWLDRALRTHVHAAALVTLAFISLWSMLPEPSFWLEVVFLLLLVCTLGLPHGGLDHVAGRAVFEPRLGSFWPAAFGLSYLGLGGLVVAAWFWAPAACLAFMLLLSAFHFGSDDSNPRLFRGLPRFIEIVGRGGGVIVIPSALHTGDVARIFNYLLPDLSQTQVAWHMETGLFWLAPPVFSCLLVSVSLHTFRWLAGGPGSRLNRDALLEIVCVGLAFTVLPPLLAFTLYFCAWHSLRQILIVSARLNGNGPGLALLAFARKAFLPTCVVVFAGALAWFLATGAGDRLPALISVVFVSLFALTVPHFCVQEAYKRLSVCKRTKHKHKHFWPPSSQILGER